MKILSSDIVKVGHGTCDFCQNHDVDGIDGEIQIRVPKVGKIEKVVEDVELVIPIFGKLYYRADDWNYKYIVDGYETKEISPLICFKCIKELSKLV